MPLADAPRTVDLLWTGGWSSTFRLLSALRLEGAYVRPHYVIDPANPCLELEVDAMQRVRAWLGSASPDLAERLLPTTSASLDDLLEDDVEAQRFARLKGHVGLGRHYEWLGRYARHAGLDEVEVGGHRDDPVMSLLRRCLRRVRERPFTGYRLAEEARETDLGIFARLSFPLADLTRADMRRIALGAGFHESPGADVVLPGAAARQALRRVREVPRRRRGRAGAPAVAGRPPPPRPQVAHPLGTVAQGRRPRRRLTAAVAP